jgi:hypothetical protein
MRQAADVLVLLTKLVGVTPVLDVRYRSAAVRDC